MNGIRSAGSQSICITTGSGSFSRRPVRLYRKRSRYNWLAPKEPEHQASLRLTNRAGTLEIMDADRQTLELVLRGMLHAE